VSAAADNNALARLRLVVFDVDGVFTDGRFYLSDDGVESKSFNTQDGFGVRQLLNAGVHVAVISGRTSAAVAQRMKELGVIHVVQGCGDKVAALRDLAARLDILPAECAYVGDDVPDMPLLREVGVSVAVANAVVAVRNYCDYTTLANGGFGAVREVCDLVLAARAEAHL
jgi:3-deoxy-D-manno-octulosonate 8-phosphate phosphatase (KDO 8-P phosphatase)